MSKLVSIQLISNGEGEVLVFINGQPYNGVYFCENDLHDDLKDLLEKYLVKYKVNEESLPF